MSKIFKNLYNKISGKLLIQLVMMTMKNTSLKGSLRKH